MSTITIPIDGSEPQQVLSVYQGQMMDALARGDSFSIQQLNTSAAASNNAAQLYGALQNDNLSLGNFGDVNSQIFQNGFNQGGGGLPWSGGSGANVGGANLTGRTAAGQDTRDAGAQAATSLSQWFLKNLGNASFITIGVLLALGALLISQRQTIVKVVSTGAKVAAAA